MLSSFLFNLSIPFIALPVPGTTFPVYHSTGPYFLLTEKDVSIQVPSFKLTSRPPPLSSEPSFSPLPSYLFSFCILFCRFGCARSKNLSGLPSFSWTLLDRAQAVLAVTLTFFPRLSAIIAQAPTFIIRQDTVLFPFEVLVYTSLPPSPNTSTPGTFEFLKCGPPQVPPTLLRYSDPCHHSFNSREATRVSLIDGKISEPLCGIAVFPKLFHSGGDP